MVLWWMERRGDWGGVQGARGDERGKGKKRGIGKRKKMKCGTGKGEGGGGVDNNNSLNHPLP